MKLATIALTAIAAALSASTPAYASGVTNWDSPLCAGGGACNWNVSSNGNMYFWSGGVLPINNWAWTGTYDSTTPLAHFSPTGGSPPSSWEPVTGCSGGCLINSCQLYAQVQIQFTGEPQVFGRLDADTGALNFFGTLQVNFDARPTGSCVTPQLSAGCNVSFFYALSPSNTWGVGNPGFPQTGSAYEETGGAFTAIDDSGQAPFATGLICGSNFSLLNGLLGLGATGSVVGTEISGTIDCDPSTGACPTTTIYPD